MVRPNEKHMRMLEFIKETHQNTGVYPSVREIAFFMGFKSTNTVDYHLRKMEEMGMLSRDPRRARSYITVGGAKPKLKGAIQSTDRRANIPLLGKVAAGWPILAEQQFDGMINFANLFRCDDQTFGLRVQGYSMINAGIMDGDIVIVRYQAQVDNGEIAVAIVKGEATVKRVFDDGGYWRLQPENYSMEPIRVRKTDLDFQIAGRVIGVIRKM